MIRKIASVVFGLYIGLLAQTANIHHDLDVKIYPEQSKIEVSDIIKINPSILGDKFKFSLNQALKPELQSGNLKLA